MNSGKKDVLNSDYLGDIYNKIKLLVFKSVTMNQLVLLLSRHPYLGMGSSFLMTVISSNPFLQTLGTWLGLFIAVITATIKIIELVEKFKKKKSDKKAIENSMDDITFTDLDFKNYRKKK